MYHKMITSFLHFDTLRLKAPGCLRRQRISSVSSLLELHHRPHPGEWLGTKRPILEPGGSGLLSPHHTLAPHWAAPGERAGHCAVVSLAVLQPHPLGPVSYVTCLCPAHDPCDSILTPFAGHINLTTASSNHHGSGNNCGSARRSGPHVWQAAPRAQPPERAGC